MNRTLVVGVVVVIMAVVILAAVYFPTANPNAGSPPGAPVELKVNGAIDSVSLSWSAPSSVGSGIIGYHIYRWYEGKSFNDSLVIAITSNHTVDPQLLPGPYHYIVRAYNDIGESPNSSMVSAIVTGYTPMVGFNGIRDSPGNYSFTVVTLSRPDLLPNAFRINVTQGGGGTLPHVAWITPDEYLALGNPAFTVGWLRNYEECEISVTYLWTNTTVWGVSFNPTA